jgi:hypothetical protein
MERYRFSTANQKEPAAMKCLRIYAIGTVRLTGG